MTGTTPLTFPKTHENSIGREDELKGRYDYETIRSIIEQSHFVNVAFTDLDGYPQCIPMVGAITEADNTLYVYLHGYHRARFMSLLPPESRVCITATLLDGIGLALSGFHSTMNHRSAILHGEVCEWDEDSEEAYREKIEAAKQVVNSACPGRWDNCRLPTKSEMATTGFLKCKIISASAKVRSGAVSDDKGDVVDEELKKKTWVGVIPTKMVLGTPEPAEYNVAPVPEYINDLIAKSHAGAN